MTVNASQMSQSAELIVVSLIALELDLHPCGSVLPRSPSLRMPSKEDHDWELRLRRGKANFGLS